MDIYRITITKDCKKQCKEKQILNINTFAELDRTGLSFNKKQKMLLLYETMLGEKICILYPGKESDRNDRNRPWDFRPILQFSNGKYMNDLSFADIWDDIYNIGNKNRDVLPLLACVFARMAYMYDHYVVNEERRYYYFDYSKNNKQSIDTGIEKLTWAKYKPDKNIIDILQNKIGYIRGASVEAYLYYNDLLAQNEDCKYFYRDIYEKNKEKWDNKIGRQNTLRTHLSVISFIKGEIKFSEIMHMFTHGGVAPIAQNRIAKVTEGLVEFQ